jgi:hypothetical protein
MTRRLDIRRLATALAIALASGAASVQAAAQAAPAPAHPISLRVVDSAGLVIEGADVSVVQGINDVRASATTDARGRVSLSVVGPDGDYQVVVRKIGFLREDQFFHAGAAPVALEVRMQRAVQTLAPVKVTATENLKRKSYFIDADEIAKHADELIDATDILKKLKPDMICGRSCSPLGAVAATTRTPARKCPGLAFSQRRVCPADNTPPSLSTSVWVNGVWIRSVATDEVCQVGRRGILAGLSPGTMQVLCEIQPEHIEQITYLDEFDNSVGKPHSNSAIFVVLKTGVGYEPGAKSYVVADTMTSKRTRVAPGTAVVDSSSAVPDSTAQKLPSYRYRLLGVFDQETGEAIQGARVIDSSTGTYMNTSVTGTVSLFYLPEGSSLVRITKDGYADLTLSVVIGPGAAEPLTLTMKKKQ